MSEQQPPVRGWGGALRVAAVVLVATFAVMALAETAVAHWLGTSLAWSQRPLTSSEARDVFGLEHLPTSVLSTQREEGGFQDPFLHVLVRVPPDAVGEFVEANGFSRDPEGSFEGPLDAFEERLREVASPHGPLRVVPLRGDRAAFLADGGSVLEYRNVAILEFDDQVWLAFVTFDT